MPSCRFYHTSVADNKTVALNLGYSFRFSVHQNISGRGEDTKIILPRPFFDLMRANHCSESGCLSSAASPVAFFFFLCDLKNLGFSAIVIAKLSSVFWLKQQRWSESRSAWYIRFHSGFQHRCFSLLPSRWPFAPESKLPQAQINLLDGSCVSCEDVPKCAAPLCHSTLKGFSITTATAAQAEINLQPVWSRNECQIKHGLVAQTIVLFKGRL